MGMHVNGAALSVGDVVWDQAMTGDNHPCLVVAKSQWQFTVRNCTSHLNSSLELLEIKAGDKTGDHSWAGKDSFVVKNGPGFALETEQVIGHEQTEEMVETPQMAPTTFYGENGPMIMWVPTGYTVLMPQVVAVYGPLQYYRVGTVKKARMDELVRLLG